VPHVLWVGKYEKFGPGCTQYLGYWTWKTANKEQLAKLTHAVKMMCACLWCLHVCDEQWWSQGHRRQGETQGQGLVLIIKDKVYGVNPKVCADVLQSFVHFSEECDQLQHQYTYFLCYWKFWWRVSTRSRPKAETVEDTFYTPSMEAWSKK